MSWGVIERVLGRRKKVRQEDRFVMTADLPKSAGHVFYQKLKGLLSEVSSACCWPATSKVFNHNAGLLGGVRGQFFTARFLAHRVN